MQAHTKDFIMGANPRSGGGPSARQFFNKNNTFLGILRLKFLKKADK